MLTKRKGFTLIELLVVIAIIAILAAILFPVFARARQKAYETQCLSQVKNLCTAFKVYTADYFGWFPHRRDWAYNNNGSLSGDLKPYINEWHMINCPGLAQFGGGYKAWGSGYRENSYAYNMRYSDHGSSPYKGGLTLQAYCSNWSDPGPMRYFPANEAWLADPSGTILLLEVSASTSGSWQNWGGPCYHNHTTGAVMSSGRGRHNWRHNSGMNIGFTDGHAQWVKQGTDGVEFSDGDYDAKVADGTNLHDLGNGKDIYVRVNFDPDQCD